MPEHHGAQHHVLGQLLRLGLHHQDRVRGARDDQVQLAVRHLRRGRVQHIGAVDIADPGGADRPHEGRPGQGQRRGGTDHRDDVGIVLQIVAQHGADDLGVVVIAAGEQRPDRPVDQPRGQGFLLGRPPFALEEAAGDLAGREGLLLVIHRHGEEVDARPGGLLRHGGAENHRLAIADDDRTVGLAGNAPCLHGQGPSAQIEFGLLDVEHVVIFLPAAERRRTCASGRDRGPAPAAPCTRTACRDRRAGKAVPRPSRRSVSAGPERAPYFLSPSRWISSR